MNAPSQTRLVASNTPPARRGRPRQSAEREQQMRGRIVEAARELFLAQGIAAVSMRNVAHAVGCSPMWLYRYFGSKQAILREVWESVLDDLFHRLEAIRDQGPHTLAMTYVAYWLDRPEHFRLVFLNEERLLGESDNESGQAMANRYKLFEDTLTQASGKGRARNGLAKRQAQGLIAVMHGITFNLITISDYPWDAHKTLAEQTVRAYLDGLAA